VALLDVVLGYDCNLACDYCTISPEMRRRSLQTQRVASAIQRARELGYDAISFTGGEPTIRGDLLPLILLARASGFEDIKVQSNGLLLSHEPNLQRLLDAGVRRFHISIHSHDPALYERIVRREGTYEAMARAVELVARRAPMFTADLIIKNDTWRLIPDAVRWVHARGGRSVHLWFVSLTDGNRENVASLPRMSEAVPAMREAFAFGREHGMDVRSLHVPRCLLGADAAHAYDPGADRVMVVTADSTFELKNSRLAGNTHIAACEGCAFRRVCPGLRPDYLARYGEAEFVDARARGAGARD
jgi:MoaA/NifB/PqqE/SkfB family radical SAM enzyme